MAMLDKRLLTVNSELSQIEKAITQPSINASDRRALQKRRHTLLEERLSLQRSQAIGQNVSENPLARYSGDDGLSASDKADKLFR